MDASLKLEKRLKNVLQHPLVMKNKNVSRNGAERSVWTVLKTQSVNAIILHQTRIRNYILQNIYICDKKNDGPNYIGSDLGLFKIIY